MKSKPLLFNLIALAVPLSLFVASGAFAQPAEAPGATQPGRTNADFLFPGGTPREFLQAIEKHYSVDWLSVADIPEDMRNVHIPVLRMSPESAAALLGGGRGRGGLGGGGGGGGFQGGPIGSGGYGNFGGGAVYILPDAENGVANSGITNPPGGGGRGTGLRALIETRNPIEAVIGLYNSLQQARPQLGQLIVEGSFAKPSVVLFQASSGHSSPASEPKMRVFPLKGIPQTEWKGLCTGATIEVEMLAKAQGRNAKPAFDITLHEDTGLLVVIGPESLLDAVGSIVSASYENQQHVASKPVPAK